MYVCVSERQGVIEKNEDREIMVYSLERGEDNNSALYLSLLLLLHIFVQKTMS